MGDDLHALIQAAKAADPGARARLCARAAGGEEAAIQALPQVYYYEVIAAVRARRHPDAEDVTQEAFLRLVRKCRDGTLPELRMPQYARTIALNIIVDAGRRRTERLYEDFDAAQRGRLEPLASGRPDERRDEEEARATYERLLAEESDRNQKVVRRWIESCLPLEAIAAEVGATEAACRNVVLRFRKELRSRLQAQGFAQP